jgi:RimJ/RimL family protein N-acetyltransferase
MIKLNSEEYSLAEDLLGEHAVHLAVQALLAGDSAGEIYLDDREEPRTVFARTMRRYFLAGSYENINFNQSLQHYLDQQVFPAGLENSDDGFTFFFSPSGWESQIIEQLLPGRYPLVQQRAYFRCRRLVHDWREFLPDGYRLVEVDQKLLENEHLDNYVGLVEEIHSECKSVLQFLHDRFGFCLLKGDQIITWCLSEYNSGGRCEIGIATLPGYRRKGLAKAATLALVEKALRSGYHEVGWHCYASNVGSIATAQSAGFEKICLYPTLNVSYEKAIAFSLIANQAVEKQAYQQALEWFQKAMDEPATPGWIYWNAAVVCAYLDQENLAFQYLHQAIDLGFNDVDIFKTSQHFFKWHQTEAWESLINQLQS